MALTPEDVVNKRFQPTKFREGYDQDEVDDFLDEVVVELRRLGQENEELRQRLIGNESRISELQRGGGSTNESNGEAGIEAAPVVEAPAVVVSAPVVSSVDAEAEAETSTANSLLLLARRLHEEHVKEGVERREALIADGEATAARLVSEAESLHRTQVAKLDSERVEAEGQIAELRSFERDYRSKLKTYIEDQLLELEASGGSASGDSSSDAASSNTGSSPVSYQGVGGN
ncbi:MAG: DivIVA domain-containing protein [Microbacteriaceae bacterium]|nr:DivIVA domain-containing protein [Microbacteriaceae bacterium]